MILYWHTMIHNLWFWNQFNDHRHKDEHKAWFNIGLPIFSNKIVIQLSQDQKGFFKSCNKVECTEMVVVAQWDLSLWGVVLIKHPCLLGSLYFCSTHKSSFYLLSIYFSQDPISFLFFNCIPLLFLFIYCKYILIFFLVFTLFLYGVLQFFLTICVKVD